MQEEYSDSEKEEFYLDAREMLNEPVTSRAQKEFNTELEYGITKARTVYLEKNPIDGDYDLEHLSKIHKKIFNGLYAFAGKVRDSEISKFAVDPESGDIEIGHFLKQSQIVNEFSKFSSRANELRHLKGLNKEQFVDEFTKLYGQINEIHPFSEGNGRATKLMMQQLAHDVGFDVGFYKTSSKEWNYACKRSLADQKVYVENPFDPKENTQDLSILKNVFSNITDYDFDREQNMALGVFSHAVSYMSNVRKKPIDQTVKYQETSMIKPSDQKKVNQDSERKNDKDEESTLNRFEP